jgi:hypothetical protein
MIGSIIVASSKPAQGGGIGAHDRNDQKSQRDKDDVSHEALRTPQSIAPARKVSICMRGGRRKDSVKMRVASILRRA